jgi:hypothetical protein
MRGILFFPSLSREWFIRAGDTVLLCEKWTAGFLSYIKGRGEEVWIERKGGREE